jgi:hypothetical protein
MKLMTFSTFDCQKYFPAIFFVMLGITVSAEACVPQPGNEYEKIFCQLKKSGRGETLPSIYDFRKNPPLTQALLLKKPAERAGIPLRIPERDNAETVERQSKLLLASAVKPEAKLPVVQKPVTVKPVTVPIIARQNTPRMVNETARVPDPVVGCSLKDFELDCQNGRYRLITNQANQYLSEGALSGQNRLNLPTDSGQDREIYLQQAYSRYLDGMVAIGLGASTMSYTKFVNLYDHIKAEKLNFPERFETMYHFLKEDKSSIGVATQPMIAQGFTTQYCSDVRHGLLACEYKKDNYLFLKL